MRADVTLTEHMSKHHCEECARLMKEYQKASVDYARIDEKVRQASLFRNIRAIRELFPMSNAAELLREKVRGELMVHHATARH